MFAQNLGTRHYFYILGTLQGSVFPFNISFHFSFHCGYIPFQFILVFINLFISQHVLYSSSVTSPVANSQILIMTSCFLAH